MSANLSVPRDWVEAVVALHLPPKLDERLQQLMDRNTEGTLTTAERDELKELVAWRETVGLLRACGLQLLGRKPA